MSRLRYALLAALVLAVAAVVAVAFLARGRNASTERSLPRGTLLAASANVFPQSFLFGQPVHVRIDAVADRRRLDPDRLRLAASWLPYTPVAPMTRTQSDVGPYTRVHWAVDLHCVQLPCVPRVGSNVRKVFEPTTVRYGGRARGGGTVEPVTVTWPEVLAWSRLDPIDPERKALVKKGTVVSRQIAANAPPWHVDTSLAAVSWAVAPGAVFWGGLGAALVLVLAAGLLLRPYLPALGLLGRGRERTRLELALDAVDGARGRTVEERKALELLAAELRESGEDRFAWAATELAWSEATPAPERTGELTGEIRKELAGRTNGHRA